MADKNCEKIHYIAPNIYCCGAGTAADTENVTGMIASQLELHRFSTGRESRVVTSLTLLKSHLFRSVGQTPVALPPKDKDPPSPSSLVSSASQHVADMLARLVWAYQVPGPRECRVGSGWLRLQRPPPLHGLPAWVDGLPSLLHDGKRKPQRDGRLRAGIQRRHVKGQYQAVQACRHSFDWERKKKRN